MDIYDWLVLSIVPLTFLAIAFWSGAFEAGVIAEDEVFNDSPAPGVPERSTVRYSTEFDDAC